MRESTPPLRPTDRDPDWSSQRSLAVVLLVMVIAVDSWFFGLMAFAADSCGGNGEPCKPAQQVQVVAVETFIGMVTGSIASLLMPRAVQWRRRRRITIAITVIFGLQPAWWVLLLGGPTP